MMGSPENEEHRDDDEGPQHKVCIEKDFWLSDTEITQEQWIKEYGYTNSMFKTATRPVEKVSWDDVQDFIKKLNSKKEGHFRLPSEAEWEYSARAGTTDAFFTGKCITVNQANYDGRSLNPFDEFKGCNTVSRTGISPELTSLVHGYSPNNWGLYNMVGNVWEWVEDCWDDNYHHTPINGAAMETGDCTRHTIRGGSWNSFPADIRSAARTPAYHDTKLEWIGFRIARDL
jgi:formylglycine-generating enzyme required for sulfatase activity